MMTQKLFCNMIVDNFCAENGIDRSTVQNWDAFVVCSSRLAVALEFLGLLNSTEYSATRGGIEYIAYDHDTQNCHTLSTREIIEMLPIYE